MHPVSNRTKSKNQEPKIVKQHTSWIYLSNVVFSKFKQTNSSSDFNISDDMDYLI